MRKLQRRYVLFACLVLGCAGVCLAFGPLAHWMAEAQLRQALHAKRVSIKTLAWSSVGRLVVSSLDIAGASIGDVRIGAVAIEYGAGLILQRKLERVTLGDVAVTIDPAALARTDPAGAAAPAGPPFYIEHMDVSGLTLRSAAAGEIVRNARLSIRRQQEGELAVESIRWSKLSVTGIQARIQCAGNEIRLMPLTAHLFSGTVEGELAVRLEPQPAFTGRLYMRDLDVVSFLDEFKLKDKLEGAGKLSGQINIAGEGNHVTELRGHLNAGQGGVLTIKDTALLKRIAAFSKTREDIVVASLKDYHYNTGDIGLWLENSVLNLVLKMQGERGKRDIQVSVHDFLR